MLAINRCAVYDTCVQHCRNVMQLHHQEPIVWEKSWTDNNYIDKWCPLQWFCGYVNFTTGMKIIWIRAVPLSVLVRSKEHFIELYYLFVQLEFNGESAAAFEKFKVVEKKIEACELIWLKIIIFIYKFWDYYSDNIKVMGKRCPHREAMKISRGSIVCDI